MLSTIASSEHVERVFTLPYDKIESDVYFLSLRLFNEHDIEISDNFYWLSVKEDQPEFEKSNWYYTPNKEFASFAELKSMDKAEVDVIWSVIDGKGAEVELTNNSDKLAFFIEMRIADDSGATVLPVMWSDNYVTLLPGETRSFDVVFNFGEEATPKSLEVTGFNVDAKVLNK